MLRVLTMIAAMRERIDAASDRGATAADYALLVMFVTISAVITIASFHAVLSNFFDTLAKAIGIVAPSS